MEGHGHLFEFAILLAMLGFAAAVSLSLRLPVVPLYIGAGLAIRASGVMEGPSEVVSFLGSLGVVFLLFSMGLEFSVRSLARAPERFVGAGVVDFALNFPVGLAAGWLLGWTWQESLFLAGILYMSSSAVVAKCIADFGRAARPETETILGVMVFEDLVIAIYLVLINTFLAGTGEGASVFWALLRSVVFVGLLMVLAWRYQEPLARLLASRSEEAFTLTVFAFVMLVAATGALIGLSDAVGAFLAGLVIGATTLKERSAHTLLPFQTLFAALFFVAFGMSLDFANLGDMVVPALVLVAVGMFTKTLGGFLGGLIAGHPPRLATVVGISLVPKGEFSVVIAGLAAAVATAESGIVALTGIYVLALSVIGPIGMREADRIRDLLFPVRPKKAPQSEESHSSGE